MTDTIEHAGLRGVVAAATTLGDVRGEEGFCHFRQYSAVDLARTRTFEDVWFLFSEGRLPTAAEADGLLAEVAPLRVPPPAVAAALPVIAASGANPVTGLRTALSLLGAGAPPLWDADPATWREQALRVCAVTPTLLAALHRLGRGEEPVTPRPDLPTAAYWLHLVTGAVPDPALVRALETYLVLTVDHGFANSTFTARVVASTGADLPAAVVAALAAFSGPLHGGAPDRALAALDEIGPDALASPDRVDGWVRDRVRAGERIMGFGHAVYRTDDPRSLLLREVATGLGGPRVALATAVERGVVRALAELRPGRRLYPNVEFYAGVVMERCGIPRELFTPTFAVSRVVGWCAHVLEQARERRIVRPSARYVGDPAPAPVPPR
jgi:citrate synthase